jgi:anti-anti-sigma regulatory factor
MGLQNATITHISGAVVRTTHLTGVTTDLGLESVELFFWLRDRLRQRTWSRIGRVLRVSQRHPRALRVLLLASIIGSFLFGAAAGTFAELRVGPTCVVVPVTFLLTILCLDRIKPIATIHKIDSMGDQELRASGIVGSLLPEELGIWRVSCTNRRALHRAPDFQQWAEKLPQHWRVIILALSPVTPLHSNALADLNEAVRMLRVQGRQLVLANVSPSQYRALEAAGLRSALERENICTDLEFAIARGMSLLHAMPHGSKEVATDARAVTMPR